MIAKLQKPEGIVPLADGSLIIAEDLTTNGHLETIVSALKQPQGLAFDGSDWPYVAEQGRDRIIRVRQAN